MDDSIDAVDRISELPAFIIHGIMSYLSVKEVAQTSILSKRWNCFRTSFPILDFDQICFIGVDVDPDHHSLQRQNERFCEGLNQFINFVDVSLLRFCELKLCMQKFRLSVSLLDVGGSSSLVDKWIGLAVENAVKELDVNVFTDRKSIYTLPQTIFSAKSVTTLKLGRCKLDWPFVTISFDSLKKLTLERVCIHEQMVLKITSICPLLEDLVFNCCWGLKGYLITKALNLKILTIYTCTNDVQRIKIVVPSLQQFTLRCRQRLRPFVIDIDGCPHLNLLNLSVSIFTDQEFHNLISKFPLLENLVVSECLVLKSIRISSMRLKSLYLGDCSNLEAIEVDTPNLLSFSYKNISIPNSSINASCPWEVEIKNEADIGTRWFLHLKEFLQKSNHIKDLTINVMSGKSSFYSDEFVESSPSFPCEVGNLSLYINMPPSVLFFLALLDGLLQVCYPSTLSVLTWPEYGAHKFIKWLYKELKHRDANCCNSRSTKCWRHYLKVVNIDSLITFKDKKTLNRDQLMDAYPILPEGTLKFRLVWCYDIPADNA